MGGNDFFFDNFDRKMDQRFDEFPKSAARLGCLVIGINLIVGLILIAAIFVGLALVF